MVKMTSIVGYIADKSRPSSIRNALSRETGRVDGRRVGTYRNVSSPCHIERSVRISRTLLS